MRCETAAPVLGSPTNCRRLSSDSLGIYQVFLHMRLELREYKHKIEIHINSLENLQLCQGCCNQSVVGHSLFDTSLVQLQSMDSDDEVRTNHLEITPTCALIFMVSFSRSESDLIFSSTSCCSIQASLKNKFTHNYAHHKSSM